MSDVSDADGSAGSDEAAPPHARTGLWLRAPVEITVAGATVSTLLRSAQEMDVGGRHDAPREIEAARQLAGSPPRAELRVRRSGGRAGAAVAHLVASDSPDGLRLIGTMKGPAGTVVLALWFGFISSVFTLAVVLAATEGVGAALGTLALALFMWAMTALSWTTGRSVLRWLESDLHDPDGSFQQALRGR